MKTRSTTGVMKKAIMTAMTMKKKEALRLHKENIPFQMISLQKLKTIVNNYVTLDSNQMSSVMNSSSDAEKTLIRNSEALDGLCTEILTLNLIQN